MTDLTYRQLSVDECELMKEMDASVVRNMIYVGHVGKGMVLVSQK